MDKNLKNALIIIGVLLVIYLAISPTRSCIRDAKPFKSYKNWEVEFLLSPVNPNEPKLKNLSSDLKDKYHAEKKDYDRLISNLCRSNNSW